MTDLMHDEEFANIQFLKLCAQLDQLEIPYKIHKTRTGVYEITATIAPYRRVIGFGRD